MLPDPSDGAPNRAQAKAFAARRADVTIVLNSTSPTQAKGATKAHAPTAKLKVNLALRINDSEAAANTVESQGGILGKPR